MKCTKSGRLCPGVPDNFEIVVRNETRKIEARIQRAARNRPHANANIVSTCKSSPRRDFLMTSGGFSYRIPASKAPTEESQRARREPTLRSNTPTIKCLDVSNETKAVARFFNVFMTNGQSFGATGIFDFIAPMYQEGSIESVLHKTTDAVALLMNARMPGFECLRKEAFQRHADALSRLREALADPVESKEDGTLMSTMFLSMYELFRGTSDAIPNFASHNHGAIALMRHRGTQQLRDERSLHLFRSARMQMIMSHVHRSGRIGTFTSDCEDWACDSMGMNDATRLSHIGIDVCAIRADHEELSEREPYLIDPEDVQDILARASAVDSRLVEWQHNLPEAWRCWVAGITTDFDSPNIPETSRFYPGPVHAYRNAHISWMLNCYRQMRVYVNATAIRCLMWLLPDASVGITSNPLIASQVFVIQQMIDDVCASTPYQLGYSSDPPPQGIHFPEELPINLPVGRGAYFSLIPLFQASLFESISDVQRRWIQGRLRAIAQVNGVRIGNVLAQARPGAIAGGLPFLGNPDKYVKWEVEEAEGQFAGYQTQGQKGYGRG
ncbi:MAG: hypothetical protein M1828_004415 [Chrysothrix sp. TS-e1954]|nr:MAG: hypothetical protein M1828_004415 [Chrysothrix sp. TS-e1954]